MTDLGYDRRPNVTVLCWHPHTGDHHQFETFQQFARWATDHLPPSGTDVWYVDHVQAVIVHATAVPQLGRWALHDEVGTRHLLSDLEPLETSRQRFIASDFEQHLAPIPGVTVRLMSEADWAGVDPAGAPLYVRFGYTPISYLQDDEIVICPAVIDRQTRELSDEEFAGYVVAVECRVMHRHGFVDAGMVSADQIEHQLDSEMFDAMPDEFALMGRVQMGAS